MVLQFFKDKELHDFKITGITVNGFYKLISFYSIDTCIDCHNFLRQNDSLFHEFDKVNFQIKTPTQIPFTVKPI